jgi:biopolymer transport protein ExbB
MSLLLQADTLSVANENLAEAVPVEKLSIELITRRMQGQIIMILYFNVFCRAISILNVLWPSMQLILIVIS